MAPESSFLTPEDQVFRINPYDEIALGIALHIRELVGEGEVNLFTLGPLIAERELRRCLAVGADRLYQIPLSGEPDPFSKSVYLARSIQTMGADLVLCGKESLDTKNGQVGVFLAHHLKMPFVSCIRDISLSGDNTWAKVQRSSGRGMREVVRCPLPAVFSVEGGGPDLSFPAYLEKKRSRTVSVHEIMYEKGDVSPKTARTRIFPPRPRPKKAPVPDSGLDAFHRIQQLLTGSKVEKKGEILTGSPESQVEEIISFLKRKGFLPREKPGKEN
ncbi:MAG: hypothetical protein WAL98_20395 [Desulfatiglandaceae bacterium]